MRLTRPYIEVISRPSVDWDAIKRFMVEVGGELWSERAVATNYFGGHDGEVLIEFGGRECYRSWDVGLNPNVSKVRTDSEDYLENILSSAHGSVLQHANYSFILHNVTRVATHELVRHAIGTAFCLAGDTEVTITSSSYSERGGPGNVMLQHVKISDLYKRWHVGFTDSLGRTRTVPASKTRRVRVLNEETQLFETAQMLDVFESGIKVCDRITLRDGKTLVCTGDHAIYTSDGWVKAKDLMVGSMVAVRGKRNALPSSNGFTPRLRSAIAVWTWNQRKVLIPDVGQCYKCEEWFDANDLQLDHVIPVIQDLAKALDITNLAPACEPCHSAKTVSEQPDRLITAGSKFIPVTEIERGFSEEMTYDLSVEGPWNNFEANKIIVHNSQESMRYVRLDDIPMWIPQWAQGDSELMLQVVRWIQGTEELQEWMAGHFKLDEIGTKFSEKKAKTSFMRRFSPQGVSTGMLLTANLRALRWIVERRSEAAAEEEIRLIAHIMGECMKKECPTLFGDFDQNIISDSDIPEWVPKYKKV